MKAIEMSPSRTITPATQAQTQISNPYQSVPKRGYWRTGVAERDPFAFDDIWEPRFAITPDDAIITAGSCFAQHFARRLVLGGYNWVDAEPAPACLSADDRALYNYGIFSFRTGNIYNAKAFQQWLQLAFGEIEEPDHYYSAQGRVWDLLRPSIEPNGFATLDDAKASFASVLGAVRSAVMQADVAVFTLGLTETWYDAESGLVYPVCPGTLAGTFDPARHKFENRTTSRIIADMEGALDILRRKNPTIRVLLTVSPVPLTATISGDHVQVATTYSKSVLRAVAGELRAIYDFVDYFPSYEIITSPRSRGAFFGANQRSVTAQGVGVVMDTFFSCMGAAGSPAPAPVQARKPKSNEDVQCDEAMLDAFGA